MNDVGITLLVFGISVLAACACCISIKINKRQMERTSGLLDPYLV